MTLLVWLNLGSLFLHQIEEWRRGGTPMEKGIDTTLEAFGKVHRGKDTRRKSKVIQ